MTEDINDDENDNVYGRTVDRQEEFWVGESFPRISTLATASLCVV
jgi:hypothetical protein